jgi:lipoprotein-anchoring transpeptidase ErfK/SrfK
MDKVIAEISRLCRELSITTSKTLVVVSLEEQQLHLIQEGNHRLSYPVSTSIKAPCSVADSAGTPLGLHRVAQKIGAEAKAGTVFFSRVNTGKAFWDFDEEIQQRNLITSRILWLSGLQPGINHGPGVDSFQRYIYIHGTNHEDRIGQRATGGCVVLANDAIIRLYDQIPTGSMVFITESRVELTHRQPSSNPFPKPCK